MALIELQYRINSYYVDAAQARLEDLGCLGLTVEDEAEYAADLQLLKQKDLTVVDQVEDFAVDWFEATAVLSVYFESEQEPSSLNEERMTAERGKAANAVPTADDTSGELAVWTEKVTAALADLEAAFADIGDAPDLQLTLLTAKEVDMDSCLSAYAGNLENLRLTEHCLIEPLAVMPQLPPELINEFNNLHIEGAKLKLSADNFPLTAVSDEFSAVTVTQADTLQEYMSQDYTLKLYTGQAFGTGEHASTLLAATLLEQLFTTAAKRPQLLAARDFIVNSTLPTALDLGCGSGILTLLLAKLLPVQYRILAWDIEAQACEVTAANYAYNAASGALRRVVDTASATTATTRITGSQISGCSQTGTDSQKTCLDLELACQALILPPEPQAAVSIYTGKQALCSLLVANLLADLHLASLERYRELLPQGGILLLSGIYRDKRLAVETAFNAADFKLAASLGEGEWEAQLWQKLSK